MEKKDQIMGIVVIAVVVIVGLVSFLVVPRVVGEGYKRHEKSWRTIKAKGKPKENKNKKVLPPLLFRKTDIYPCSECHDPKEDNPKRRVLTEEHKDISFRHGEKKLWCLHCHSFQNRDKLHLSDGTLVDFQKAERLCAQCHGKKFDEWEAGVHGRRTGRWQKGQTYLNCLYCHDPHTPKFKPIKAKPMPVRPSQIKWKR